MIPPLQLIERYYQCTLTQFGAAFEGVGLSIGNADVFIFLAMSAWLFTVSMYIRTTQGYTDGVFHEVETPHSNLPSQEELIMEINNLQTDMKDLITFMMDQAKRNGDETGAVYLEKMGHGKFQFDVNHVYIYIYLSVGKL